MSNMAYADLASTKYVQDYVTAKTPTANGSTLGLVKAGTNISISNGMVNVELC